MYICVCVCPGVYTCMWWGWRGDSGLSGSVSLWCWHICPWVLGSRGDNLTRFLSPYSVLGTLVIYVEPCRGRPNYPVPISLIHWNLLLHSPCIPIHWCQNNNNNKKKLSRKQKQKPLLHTALILTLFPLEIFSLKQKKSYM